MNLTGITIGRIRSAVSTERQGRLLPPTEQTFPSPDELVESGRLFIAEPTRRNYVVWDIPDVCTRYVDRRLFVRS
jgi:hypothetical protein